MRHVTRGLVMTIVLTGLATPAVAQQPRRVGLVMGYPATAGVLWHVSDWFALRPDFAASRQRSETTTTLTAGLGGQVENITSATEGWTTSIGVSGLFYLGAPDPLRFYLSPRLAYAWTRSESSSEPLPLAQLGAYESHSDGFLAAGSFGAQYAAHDRFRLFGELGVSYSDQDGWSGYSVSRSDLHVTSFGLRSGVGVVVYF